jgi:hypothetical protein
LFGPERSYSPLVSPETDSDSFNICETHVLISLHRTKIQTKQIGRNKKTGKETKQRTKCHRKFSQKKKKKNENFSAWSNFLEAKIFFRKLLYSNI